MTDTAKSSLNHIFLSTQELEALSEIIQISLQAFKLIGFPLYYDTFLLHIYNLVQLGCVVVEKAHPFFGYEYKQFSLASDVLSHVLREIGTITAIRKDKN